MSSGCGDVLSLEDLRIAKLHQLFEAEVITGKQGGVASGADIDYATNQVTGQTQKTMPAVLRDAGFSPASFTFTTGGTLSVSDANKAVLWPKTSGGDGNYYSWTGALPKVVPANSTPPSTGGVADGAWKAFGDITLEDRLANTGGDKMVGSSYGGTVYSDYQLSPFVKFGSFGSLSTVTNAKHAVFYSSEGLWYASKSTTFPVTVPAAPDANWRCVGLLNGYPVYDVRNWGVVADGVTDNTQALMTLWTKTQSDAVQLEYPRGVINHTAMAVPKPHNNTSWVGAGSKATAFYCTDSTPGHIAIKLDAWPDPVNPNQPFVDGFSLRGIHFEGNSNTTTVIDLQGFSRYSWDDVTVWGANSTSGTGVFLRACTLNSMYDIATTQFRNLAGSGVNKPAYGMQITTGYRAGAFQGNSSANVFINCKMEGVLRGIVLIYADQQTFIGGTSEGNSDYGLFIAADCRYNTFIGMGFENLNATTGDIVDNGWYSSFKNIYSSNKTVLRGKSTVLEGGYFERVDVQSVAAKVECKHFRVNHWNTGNGGFYNAGVGTVVYDVYDSDATAYINTTADRTAATLSTTPVSGGTLGTWTNSTYLPVSFYLGGATSGFTSARILVGGNDQNSVAVPNTVPQQVHLEAGDSIQVAWSSSTTAPVCSYRPKRGYN